MVNTLGSKKQFDEGDMFAFFENIETIVKFLIEGVDFVDLKEELEPYYEKAVDNVLFYRVQNQMRLRANDNGLKNMDEKIARLETRWAIPFASIQGIFNAAIENVQEFEERTDELKKENKIDDKTQNQDEEVNKVEPEKRFWMDKPEIIDLLNMGQKPYKRAIRTMHHMRRMRSKYKYLELYLFNIQRDTIKLAHNLALILEIVRFIRDLRENLAQISKDKEEQNKNNKTVQDLDITAVGAIILEIIRNNRAEDSVRRIKKMRASIKDIINHKKLIIEKVEKPAVRVEA